MPAALLNPIRYVALSMFCVLFAAPALAIDSLLLELGTSEGREDVDRYGGAARWDLGWKWFETGDWSLRTHLELSLTYWDGKQGTTGENDLFDFGLTPILRYESAPSHSIAPFVEMGVGVHGYTQDGIGNRDFGIPFAFGTHFGAGLRLGEGGRYELVYRFQHLSNAGLSSENPGINFHVLQLGYHF